MLPAVASGIVTGDAPVSYWPIFFPVSSNTPRSLCESQLGPVFFPFLKKHFNVANTIWGVFTWGHQIQTKKLSILVSFYFHEVLQHLKTFIYTKFRFQRVLCFAIKDAWISRLLRDEAFSWRLGKLLRGFKKFLFFEILLSKHFLSWNKYYF